MSSYTSFEDLDCYKKCRLVRKWIYTFLLKHSIRDRDIIQNLKRAGRSTTRNIAEGFGRYHHKENRQYCRISLGSLHEILNDLNILEDEKFCKNEDLTQGRTLVFQTLKPTHGYINYLAKKI